jgi:oligoribonuclease NrnB/cAMP/cGMP phosphodiesterase (DHH superfamily)
VIITVLDVALEKNKSALERRLDADANVFYADHHFPGEIPEHDNFEAHINVASGTCTSLIVNEYFESAQANGLLSEPMAITLITQPQSWATRSGSANMN